MLLKPCFCVNSCQIWAEIQLKATTINISTLTMDEMCNVKGVAHSDKHADNYHQTLQFPSALQSVSSSSLFWFCGTIHLLFSFSLTALINLSSSRSDIKWKSPLFYPQEGGLVKCSAIKCRLLLEINSISLFLSSPLWCWKMHRIHIFYIHILIYLVLI